MARRPAGTLPSKLPGRAELVGSYRLLNHPQVTPEKILDAHRRQVLDALAELAEEARPRLLLLHDTTVLDYSGLSVKGLGQVGDGHGRGLYAQHSLLVEPQRRQVLGLMNQILHVRDRVPRGETKRQRQQRATRESRLWKQAVVELPAWPAGLEVTDVSDRGSDLTEYLAYELAAGRTFIVRSQHNRVQLAADGTRALARLHDHLRALPARAEQTVKVRTAQGAPRTVAVTLAWQTVRLRPPRQARGEHDQRPLTVQALLVREALPAGAAAAETPAAGAQREGKGAGQAPSEAAPLEWILLTNRPLESLEQAREVVADYACRWIIEEYHKAQKTGCGIETLQLTTRHGLDNAISLLSVLAVWVLGLKTLARDPATAAQPACRHVDPLYVQLAALQIKAA